MNCKNKLFMTNRKAFTLIELLIVIAIIGILFIVLVSKVDFATDKAKATGVQTDFRSFQLAFDTVAKENAGFNTFGYNTGDNAGGVTTEGGAITLNGKAYTYTNALKDLGDGKRNSYDVGDDNLDGIQNNGEVWTGRKVYTETFTNIYTLMKPGTSVLDTTVLAKLETAINANLDPKLHITIKDDGEIVMANGAQDPWKNEYHGYYISKSVEQNGADRGAIVMYSDGANGVWGSAHDIDNGVVSVTVPNSNQNGKDDYSIVSVYTYVNGYGEVKNITTGFSNNQLMSGNNINSEITNTPNNGNENITPPVAGDDEENVSSVNVKQYIFTLVDDNSTSLAFNANDGIDVYVNYIKTTTIPSQCVEINENTIIISGTGMFDGTFNIMNNGNLAMNGVVVATATSGLLDENGQFRYTNIKYNLAGSQGSAIMFDNQGQLHLYNSDGSISGTVPSMCVKIEPAAMTISGVGEDYDGTYFIIDNGAKINSIIDNEIFTIAVDVQRCDHRTGRETITSIDNQHFWYNWYDENMNVVPLGSLPEFESFKNYTLRCDTCLSEIPTKIIGNYIYLYNAFMEPFIVEGEFTGTICPDVFYTDIHGWFAMAYDGAKSDGLLSTIDGKPVTAVFASNNIVIPSTTTIFYCSYISDEDRADGHIEYTYAGTMDEFKLILANNYDGEAFVEQIERQIGYGTYPNVTVHCSDGDIELHN